jgi:hypothetical protein
VEKLTSILVVLDHSARDAPLLAKSLILARDFSAQVELFSCDVPAGFRGAVPAVAADLLFAFLTFPKDGSNDFDKVSIATQHVIVR